jgi:hypothetical protein
MSGIETKLLQETIGDQPLTVRVLYVRFPSISERDDTPDPVFFTCSDTAIPNATEVLEPAPAQDPKSPVISKPERRSDRAMRRQTRLVRSSYTNSPAPGVQTAKCRAVHRQFVLEHRTNFFW